MFEDLPNELLYDIFEFLELSQLHPAFRDLNQRFRSLLTETMPMRVNLCNTSKSTFDEFYQPVLQHHRRRISFLRIANLFTVDYLFPSIRAVSKLTRLETLTITNLQSTHAGKLLKHLATLPMLSSLTLMLIDEVEDKNKLYRRIFRLPALRYCKLSLLKSVESEALPLAVGQSSDIEQLILNNGCDLQELASLLSYVPRLRRLSLVNIYGTLTDAMEAPATGLAHLTELSIGTSNMTFDELELLVRNHFPCVEVLRFSRNFEEEFLRASRWERLITAHMPRLRVFDICIIVPGSMNETFVHHRHSFQSPFWLERQWFFSHQIHPGSGYSRLTFFSTKPYRRRHFTISGSDDDEYASEHDQTQYNSVRSVCIESEKALNKCHACFPKARELILAYKIINNDQQPLRTALDGILPLAQLTKLTVSVPHYHTETILDLLDLTVNVRTLVLDSTSLGQSYLTELQKKDSFRRAAASSQVTNLIVLTRCTFETVTFLFDLCPRVQHLTVNIHQSVFETTLRFLWSKDHAHTRHLFSLHLRDVQKEQINVLHRLLQTDRLLDHYEERVSHSNPENVYVWWQ